MTELDEIVSKYFSWTVERWYKEGLAEIESYFAARFERALGGKEKYDGVEPTYDRMIGARNRLRAEARTRWYTPEPKGEQHG